jgi:hypothetical protein
LAYADSVCASFSSCPLSVFLYRRCLDYLIESFGTFDALAPLLHEPALPTPHRAQPIIHRIIDG